MVALVKDTGRGGKARGTATLEKRSSSSPSRSEKSGTLRSNSTGPWLSPLSAMSRLCPNGLSEPPRSVFAGRG